MNARLVSVLVVGCALSAPGQNGGNAPYTYIPRAVFEALAKADGDHPARVLEIAKSYNLGAYLLHLSPRKPGATVQDGWAHHDISELYYVIRGSGAFLIGGQIQNPKQDDPNTESVKTIRGPSMTGQMKGYAIQRYTAGDVIVVPVDVPHLPTYEVTETVDMLRVVIDPQRALQLK